MYYTIAQIAEKTGLTAHTLRYYDKEGLLPFVERSGSGIRQFKEIDIEWLAVISCLKDTGMPVKQVKVFIDWCMLGDKTLRQRHNLFLEQKKQVDAQIAQLKKYLKKINYKIAYYETALKAGTEKVHTSQKCRTQAKKKMLAGAKKKPAKRR